MTRPLRVLIDARMLLGRFSGVARFVTRLVDSLATQDDLRIVALCGDEPYEPWSRRTDIDLICTDFSRPLRSPLRRFIWEESRLRRWIRRTRCDVFHATWNQGIPPLCPVPAVLTVHDLIPWQEFETKVSSRWQAASYRHATRIAFRRAHRITAVSGFTRQQILDRLPIEAGRVATIYNGVDLPPAAPPATDRATNHYVLYVGGHEERKNVESVLTVLEAYWQRIDGSLELRMTGRPESLSASAAGVFRRLPKNAPIQFLGNPDDDALAKQYAHASALLLLSRAEGFGLPALEAMAHGCPVIAARAGALPEVVGEAGVLVDPEDIEAAADAIGRIVSLPGHATQLACKGRARARLFSWDRAAENYGSTYRSCFHRRQFPSFEPQVSPGTLVRPTEPA